MNKAKMDILSLTDEELSDLPIRVSDQAGPLEVLSIYKSECGKFIWVDVAVEALDS